MCKIRKNHTGKGHMGHIEGSKEPKGMYGSTGEAIWPKVVARPLLLSFIFFYYLCSLRDFIIRLSYVWFNTSCWFSFNSLD